MTTNHGARDLGADRALRGDGARGVVLVNDCFEEITGRREEELLGDGWIATVHPDDRSRVIEETARLQSDTSVEHRMLRPDGTVRYVAPALRLENSLHRAVAREEFRVFFQPVVELAKGACLGVEALARWQHPERGISCTTCSTARLKRPQPWV